MLVCAISLLLTTYPSLDRPLFQIGTVDHSTAEFAYAPNGYRQFHSDPVYIVGESKPRDWPYVLPGTSDDWAQGRRHDGLICLGLKGVRPDQKFTFTLDLADSHNNMPPRLQLSANGTEVATWQPPKGTGDESIEGHPEKGIASRWTVDIPAKLLKNGSNVLRLRNVRGSWILFDAISLTGPDEVSQEPFTQETTMELLPQDQIVLKSPKGDVQPVKVEVTRFGAATTAKVSLAGHAQTVTLKPGRQVVEVFYPRVKKLTTVPLSVQIGGSTLTAQAKIAPVRSWEVRLFPHSHVDIGYTDLQPYLLKMHERNLTDAITVGKESAGNPVGSRYLLNIEAMWALDRYVQSATPAQKQAITRAFKSGMLASSAGYCNLLTGLMRPEEVMRSYSIGLRVQRELGIHLDTVSLTDVPGITWGEVTAMNQAGVKNLVLMPNFGDRIGGVTKWWRDKPFFWIGPNGTDRVFVWETVQYGVGHGIRGWDGNRNRIIRGPDPLTHFIDGYIFDDINQKAASGYPYDLIALPWSCSDNGPVDAGVAPATKAWNAKYAVPKVVISSLSDACAELKRRYGSKIPVVKGDLTPYWEDGAGSSAAETAINRATADRLVQAETLSALQAPTKFKADAFREAWRNVLLYSEHTWGAWNSIGDPDAQNVKDQWKLKQGFALDASKQSKALLGKPAPAASAYDVLNTTSWPRTDLVTLTAAQSSKGNRVVDAKGKPMPSQRLASGELAVLVRDVPAFGSKRIQVVAGQAFVEGRVSTTGTSIKSATDQVSFDPTTGAIEKWQSGLLGANLISDAAGQGLNQYLYLLNSDLKGLQTTTLPEYETVDRGPLVATLRARSHPAGVKELVQEVRLVAGLKRIDITNILEKTAVREKEGVHFAFPFAVPGGQIRVDTPFAVIRPELDQMPGANKNWFCAQRYVDVSNAKFGVTCAVLDAPLVEVGGITANIPGSQMNPDVWVQHLKPTQTFYSWALNNHWHTNYRADQEGRLVFRFSLTSHGAFQADEAERFGTGIAQPLLVVSAANRPGTLLTVSDPRVLVTSLRPSDDGKAILVRLWGASGKAVRTRLTWRSGVVGKVYSTDLNEKPLRAVSGEVTVPGNGVLSLRATLK